MEIKKIKTLRSFQTHIRYEKHLVSKNFPKCYICESKPIKFYKYWKIIENEYPYDEIATVNHMIAPLQHKKGAEFTKQEIKEFQKIKTELHEKYDMIVENTRKQKSIPGHYHLHLLEIKERNLEIENGLRPIFFAQKMLTAKI